MRPKYATRYLSVKHPRAPELDECPSVGGIAIYSILRDWVKGQTTAIEVGVLTFEAAFLSHIMLPSGLRVIEHLEQNRLLPALNGDDA